ncbi:hypothetical protein WA026_006997 [Henosepilachna vigintioctopunctata]|uniref:Uncharacterized protein n=1 Tax=Henosepilachna vigintioctopunctata TaxID=420089 RepID=A0AAW1VBC1_9CUCU
MGFVSNFIETVRTSICFCVIPLEINHLDGTHAKDRGSSCHPTGVKAMAITSSHSYPPSYGFSGCHQFTDFHNFPIPETLPPVRGQGRLDRGARKVEILRE